MDNECEKNSTVKNLEDHEIVNLVSNILETNLENSKSPEAKVDGYQNICPYIGD